jgi:hypothetical protein
MKKLIFNSWRLFLSPLLEVDFPNLGCLELMQRERLGRCIDCLIEMSVSCCSRAIVRETVGHLV